MAFLLSSNARHLKNRSALQGENSFDDRDDMSSIGRSNCPERMMESHMRRHAFEFQSGAQNNDFDDFFGAEPNEEKVYFEDFTTTTNDDGPGAEK